MWVGCGGRGITVAVYVSTCDRTPLPLHAHLPPLPTPALVNETAQGDTIAAHSNAEPFRGAECTALSPFLIGRMFLREPSWKYSAKLVGS